jgi:hypothetical protein
LLLLDGGVQVGNLLLNGVRLCLQRALFLVGSVREVLELLFGVLAVGDEGEVSLFQLLQDADQLQRVGKIKGRLPSRFPVRGPAAGLGGWERNRTSISASTASKRRSCSWCSAEGWPSSWLEAARVRREALLLRRRRLHEHTHTHP